MKRSRRDSVLHHLQSAPYHHKLLSGVSHGRPTTEFTSLETTLFYGELSHQPHGAAQSEKRRRGYALIKHKTLSLSDLSSFDKLRMTDYLRRGMTLFEFRGEGVGRDKSGAMPRGSAGPAMATETVLRGIVDITA